MFQHMTDEQKNLYGCIDFLVSVQMVTRLPLHEILNDIESKGKFDDFFELGFFRASGMRPFKLSGFLEGNYGNRYMDVVKELNDNKITELRNEQLVTQIYNFVLSNGRSDLKNCLLMCKDKLDNIKVK